MAQATPEDVKKATDAFLKRHMSEDGQRLNVQSNDRMNGPGNIVCELLDNEWRERRAYQEVVKVIYR